MFETCFLVIVVVRVVLALVVVVIFYLFVVVVIFYLSVVLVLVVAAMTRKSGSFEAKVSISRSRPQFWFNFTKHFYAKLHQKARSFN